MEMVFKEYEQLHNCNLQQEASVLVSFHADCNMHKQTGQAGLVIFAYHVLADKRNMCSHVLTCIEDDAHCYGHEPDSLSY